MGIALWDGRLWCLVRRLDGIKYLLEQLAGASQDEQRRLSHELEQLGGDLWSELRRHIVEIQGDY